MLECNRINSSLNYNNIDESEDVFKNRWINNVNSYGIVIDPGDVINCESAAINTIGAASDTIEILGTETNGLFVDNKIGIDYTYYVNDTGNHLVKLPLTESVTYMTYELDAANRLTSGNLNRNKFMGVPKVAAFVNGPTDDTNPYTLPSSGHFVSEIPDGKYVYYYTLKRSPASSVGQGFVTGNTYSSIDQVGSGYTSVAGYEFKMVNTINEGGKAGIPDKIQLYNIPASGGNPNTDNFCRLAAPGSGSGYSPQDILLHSVQRKEFRTKRLTGPTGSRYYFSELGYTGPVGGYIGATPDINFKPAELNPVFTLRTSKVIHQVPEGLNTPDNIATILTDQLHRPTRYKADTKNNYIDYSNMAAKFNNLRDEIQTGKPPLVETPSYTPMPCNYGTNARLTTKVNSYVDSLAYYYSLIGWKFPERPMGMGWTLSLNYGITNWDIRNQINSGSDQRTLVGDWTGITFSNGVDNAMEIGGLGQTLTHLMDFETESNGFQPAQGTNSTPAAGAVPNKFVNKYAKGGWVVTNAYFTEAVIARISDGLKKCELYMGDRSINTDTTTQNYIDNQACVFDLGIYMDELSNDPAKLNLMGAFEATEVPSGSEPDYQEGTPQTFINELQPGQLRRMNSSFEGSGITGGIPANNNIVTDHGVNIIPIEGPAGAQAWSSNKNHLCGTLPYNTAYTTYNNGQQLSSFIATSRWREEFVFDENNIDASYQVCFDRLQTQGLAPGTPSTTNNLQFGAGTNTITQMFNSSYTDQDTAIGTQTYTDLIALARKYDVACIPVFPSPRTATNQGNATDFNQFGGRPYVAFRSHMELGGSGTQETFLYDPIKGGTDQKWQIDARNGGYGIQMGFDQSFTRNDCAMLFNTNYGNTQDLGTSAGYSPVVFMGASNPSFDFDTNLSRFTITGLNTPMTIGNGLPTNSQTALDPNPDPEQQCYNAMKSGQISTQFGQGTQIQQNVPALPDGAHPLRTGFYASSNPLPLLGEYVLQDSLALIDSYTGLAINRLFLYDKDGNETSVEMTGLFGDGITKWKNDVLDGTLFGKMGFKINQLLPSYGSAQATFNNPLTFETFNESFEKKFLNTSKPQTTGAFISSAEYQPAETNDINLPYYGMGINVGKSARPSVTQASITAQTLPTKLDYPYLNIYSSIVQQGTDTEYYGGVDGKSRLPCIGYITRNYNEGDFFYGMEQGFSYTATKSFTLTEIQTDIRLPNGNRPRLQPHNSVIYKITKSPPQPTGTQPPQSKKKKQMPPQQ